MTVTVHVYEVNNDLWKQ